MVRKLVISMVAAAPLLLACSAGEEHDAQLLPPSSSTTLPASVATTSTSTTSTSTTVVATTSTTSTTERPPAAPHYLCPDGGLDEVRELQDAVDQGHQPWRLSAPDVAAACTFGVPGTQVQAVGPHRYRVTQPSTGRTATVDLAQPLGPGTVWAATAIT
jgi:hypothetical protein